MITYLNFWNNLLLDLDILYEIINYCTLQNPGRLKLQSNSIIFKNNKTGKIDQYPGTDVEKVHWLKRARGHCLKFLLSSGTIHRYDGFKEGVKLYFTRHRLSNMPV